MAASPGLTTAALNMLVDALKADITVVSLHTASPGTTGANEVSSGSYARTAETYAAAASGASDLATPITFGPVAGTVAVTHYGLWAGSTFRGGNPCTNKTLGSGDSYTLTSAPITLASV
jgi:hypothetical protein